MTPDEVNHIIDDLAAMEGDERQMYLDNRGLVTVGIGKMLKTAEAAQALAFQSPTGGLATQFEIRMAWESVKGMVPGRLPAYYHTARNMVALPENEPRRLAAADLEHDYLPGIRGLLPGFDGYPLPAKRALIDLAYNLGVVGLSKFGNLLSCCRSGDWKDAAMESHVFSSREDRNKWRAARFLEAADMRELVA